MSSAVETLGSQLNGAKEYQQVGIVLWRCIIILGLMLPGIGIIWYFTGDIFRALGNIYYHYYLSCIFIITGDAITLIVILLYLYSALNHRI
jgi:Na+-driven multidrug efflux pump